MKECDAPEVAPKAQVLFRSGSKWWMAGALAFFLSPAQAEDGYLKALEAEADKLSPGGQAPESAQEPDDTGNPNRGVSREQFETLLRDNYRGTYLFYKELPANNQEEMYADYQRGVSIGDLRDKIMDRYLRR